MHKEYCVVGEKLLVYNLSKIRVFITYMQNKSKNLYKIMFKRNLETLFEIIFKCYEYERKVKEKNCLR